MSKCDYCLWAEQCGGEHGEDCDYYSSIDDTDDLVDYALDLVQRKLEYDLYLKEMEGDA